MGTTKKKVKHTKTNVNSYDSIEKLKEDSFNDPGVQRELNKIRADAKKIQAEIENK